jgi:hypothetical protein
MTAIERNAAVFMALLTFAFYAISGCLESRNRAIIIANMSII